MDGLWTALQFFTRIRVVRQSDWNESMFGRSIPFIPAVGLVIGGLLAVCNALLAWCGVADLLRAAMLVVVEILLTGGLLYDGVMDTADGLFSGRGRERMLEIMKDSRVGANGVLAAICLVLLKWSLWSSLAPYALSWLLLLSQFISRIGLVGLICLFPYARPEGIGGLFSRHAKNHYVWLALLQGVVFSLLFYPLALGIAGLVWLVLYCLARRAEKQLGGLTGDVYGALTETAANLFMLAAYALQLGGLLSAGWLHF